MPPVQVLLVLHRGHGFFPHLRQRHDFAGNQGGDAHAGGEPVKGSDRLQQIGGEFRQFRTLTFLQLDMRGDGLLAELAHHVIESVR